MTPKTYNNQNGKKTNRDKLLKAVKGKTLKY